MRLLTVLAPLLGLVLGVAGTQAVTLEWQLGYKQVEFNNGHSRRVISVNNQWPNPQIEVRQGQQLIIHLTNRLDTSTSLHFHGIFQNGSNAMDGATFITQCPIPPGAQFTYNFTITQPPGTFWYHSHDSAQYGDGLRGAFVIKPEHNVVSNIEYTRDETVLLSDWYYTETSLLVDEMNRPDEGGEPSIDSSLINDAQFDGFKLNVRPAQNYYLRLINVGMSGSQYFYVEEHSLRIVEVDGVEVEPHEVEGVYVATGQRYGVILTTKDSADRNYAMIQATNLMMHKLYSNNWLVYDDRKELNQWTKNAKSIKTVDDFDLKPLTRPAILQNPTHQFVFNYTDRYFTRDKISYYMMNSYPHLSPKIPTLLTVTSADNTTDLLDPRVYGLNTNAFIINRGEVVEIVVNSLDHMRHPFHLHGHNFQLVARGSRKHYNESTAQLEQFPVIRDTAMIPGRGYIVIRFVADNPGVWFFHCHTEWHAVQGLGVVFVESPLDIHNQFIAPDHLQVCRDQGIKTKGNGLGNDDYLDYKEDKRITPWGEEEDLGAEKSGSQSETDPNSKDMGHSHHEIPDNVSLQSKITVLIIYFAIVLSIASGCALLINRTNWRQSKRFEIQRVEN